MHAAPYSELTHAVASPASHRDLARIDDPIHAAGPLPLAPSPRRPAIRARAALLDRTRATLTPTGAPYGRTSIGAAQPR